jgi:hypothetical protein
VIEFINEAIAVYVGNIKLGYIRREEKAGKWYFKPEHNGINGEFYIAIGRELNRLNGVEDE